jgi:aspartate 1-decarboxylase
MEPEEARSHKPTVVIVDENNDPKDVLENTLPTEKNMASKTALLKKRS